jgi:hypothetical protein
VSHLLLLLQVLPALGRAHLPPCVRHYPVRCPAVVTRRGRGTASTCRHTQQLSHGILLLLLLSMLLLVSGCEAPHQHDILHGCPDRQETDRFTDSQNFTTLLGGLCWQSGHMCSQARHVCGVHGVKTPKQVTPQMGAHMIQTLKSTTSQGKLCCVVAVEYPCLQVACA